MVDHPLLAVRPHLLVILPILVKHPFEVWHSFTPLYLSPYFPVDKNLPHHIFIVVASRHYEGRLIAGLYHLQLFRWQFLQWYIFVMTHAWTMRQASGVKTKWRLLFNLFLVISVLLVRLPSYLEIMDVAIARVSLLADKKGHLLWIGRTDFFAYQNIW